MRRNVVLVIVQLFCVVQALSAGVASAETKVACVGDSITALPTSWCGDLSEKLGTGYDVANFGVSGTNLLKDIGQPYWTCAQFTPSHDFAPNLVLIMLGTNDGIPRTWEGKDHFVADYEALIDSYTSLASHPRVYAMLPPPAGTGPFGHSGELIANEVIPMIEQAAMNKGVTTIDIFTAFGGVDFDPGLYGSLDQIHPNAEGQQLICDTVYAVLMSSGGLGNAGAGGSGGSGGAGGSAGAGGNGGVGGSAGGAGGSAGGTDVGAGGMAGGMATTIGSGGNASTAGSASVAGAGGSADAGGNTNSGVTPPTAGASAPIVSAPESSGSGGGCRTAGSSTSGGDATAVLLVLFGIAIRGRKRSAR